MQIKGVTDELDELISQIKCERARRSESKIDEPLAFDLFDPNADCKLNDQFLRVQLLTDCLLRTEETTDDRTQLIRSCQKEYRGNRTELALIEEFQENYSSNRSIRWFTRQGFLSRMFNRAVRIHDIDRLFLFRFFIHDIERQLRKNQYPHPVRLYRTQLIADDQLKAIKDAVGGFLMINTFLSTTIDREASLACFDHVDHCSESHLQRVLFEIDADPRLTVAKPFANIIWLSYCFGRQEVLMAMGSIFRLVHIHDDDDQLCIVRMVLCGDHDADLTRSFEQLRKENPSKEMESFSFGHVLYDMLTFDDAKKFYADLLADLPSDHRDQASRHHALAYVAADKGDYDLSLEWYEKLLDLLVLSFDPNDSRLADAHQILGNMFWNKKDSQSALDSYQKALPIYKRAYSEHHPAVADCTDKIGTIYESNKKYVQALNHYERVLAIRERCLPPVHPELATTHCKLATTRLLLCHYSLALEHYKSSLKIKLSYLPCDHVDVASDYRGMGNIYQAKGEVKRSLMHYLKAAELYRNLLPSNHCDVLDIERTIRFLAPQVK